MNFDFWKKKKWFNSFAIKVFFFIMFLLLLLQCVYPIKKKSNPHTNSPCQSSFTTSSKLKMETGNSLWEKKISNKKRKYDEHTHTTKILRVCVYICKLDMCVAYACNFVGCVFVFMLMVFFFCIFFIYRYFSSIATFRYQSETHADACLFLKFFFFVIVRNENV